MNAWMCDCGYHGIVDSLPASAGALMAHLAATGHGQGEYYYGGCPEQRTTVTISRTRGGQFAHRVTCHAT